MEKYAEVEIVSSISLFGKNFLDYSPDKWSQYFYPKYSCVAGQPSKLNNKTYY
jgi:hypothetical protein